MAENISKKRIPKMCEPGQIKKVVTVDNTIVDVDSCIANFIQWLNDNGVRTMSCCCGHGKTSGGIRMSLIIDVRSVANKEFLK